MESSILSFYGHGRYHGQTCLYTAINSVKVNTLEILNSSDMTFDINTVIVVDES